MALLVDGAGYMDESGGEQNCAGFRVLWVGKQLLESAGKSNRIEFLDGSWVQPQPGGSLELEFRGPGSLGVTGMPSVGLASVDETAQFFGVEVGWTGLVVDREGRNFLRFQHTSDDIPVPHSQVLISGEGDEVRAIYAGAGLLVVRRVVEVVLARALAGGHGNYFPMHPVSLSDPERATLVLL